jgi:hypothetical protein
MKRNSLSSFVSAYVKEISGVNTQGRTLEETHADSGTDRVSFYQSNVCSLFCI